MKTIRFILAIVLAFGVLMGLPIAAQAQENEKLTLDRAIMISDTEIVLEFSEPVAINKFQNNRGPYSAIRWVNASGNVGYAIDKDGINGDALQWQGELSYVSSDPSKLVWKINMDRFGCKTIEEALNCQDEDALRSIEKNKLTLCFVLEEVPFNEDFPAADGKVDNVTTEDGSRYLFPSKPNGWESCVMEIERNYNYPLDRTDISGVSSGKQEWDFDVIWHGEGIPVIEEQVIETTKVVKNDPLVVAMIFGADVLVAAGALITVIVLLKKKKGKAA